MVQPDLSNCRVSSLLFRPQFFSTTSMKLTRKNIALQLILQPRMRVTNLMYLTVSDNMIFTATAFEVTTLWMDTVYHMHILITIVIILLLIL